MSDPEELLNLKGLDEKKVQLVVRQIRTLDSDPEATAEVAFHSLQNGGVSFGDLFNVVDQNSSHPIQAMNGNDLVETLVVLYQEKRAKRYPHCQEYKKRKLNDASSPFEALSAKRARQLTHEVSPRPEPEILNLTPTPPFDIISDLNNYYLVDIVEKIFSYFDATTIDLCEKVTEQWYTTIRTTKVWQKLHQKMMSDPFFIFLADKYGWGERLCEIEKKVYSNESQDHCLVDVYAQICLELSSLDKENTQIWRNGVSTIKMVRTHTDEKRGVRCIYADRKHILAGLRDSRVKVFDRDSRRCILILEGHEEEISAIVANEQHVLCGTVDGVMQVWSRQTGSLVVSKAAHRAEISSLSLGSGVLVAGSRDKTVSVWDWDPLQDDPLQEKFVIAEHKALVSCVCVNDKNIFIASEDTSVKMWGLSTGSMVHTFQGHNEDVCSIDVSENFLVSGGTDAIILWDIVTGRQLRRITVNVGITCVAINARHIITGDEKGCLQIYDARLALDPNTPDKNVCLQRLPMHHGRVYAVQLSFEGFFSCAKDGCILIASYS